MGSVESNQANTWLSLVAETAGVAGATVARVELRGFSHSFGHVRAIVQIQDTWGDVVGATHWEGDAAELAQGVMIDLGCDLGAAIGTRIVGWTEEEPFLSEPRVACAPDDAAAQYFEPGRAMKLMLARPAPVQAAQAA